MDFIDFSAEKKYSNDASYTVPIEAPYSNSGRYDLNSPDASGNDGNQDETQTTQPSVSIWSLKFYQKYFDVNTDEVLNRVMWSMLPTPNVNFLQHFIQNKPDLYGPFWICVTLVFAIGISGNVADYFQSAVIRNYPWKYDFHAVSLAGLLIFLYSWCLPFILWGALQWSSVAEVKFKLLELICVYGYIMAIYIPMSVLWIIPVAWIQWVLTFVGSFLSGLVLCLSLRPAFTQSGYTILVLLFALHLIIATCFMRFFFHVSKYHGPLPQPLVAPTSNSSLT